MKMALVWLAQSDDDGITDDMVKAQSAPQLLKTLLPTRGTLLPLAAKQLDKVTSQSITTLDQHSHGCRHTRRQKSAGV